MYVYYQNAKGNWSVGFFSPDGSSNFESEWNTKEEAANRVHWLNGGNEKSNSIVLNLLPVKETDEDWLLFKERYNIIVDMINKDIPDDQHKLVYLMLIIGKTK